MTAFDLHARPVHLGLGATAEICDPFDGTMDWYMRYGAAHGGDGAEGRLVAVHTFDGDWSTWEVHPKGAELVYVIDGAMTLVQRTDDGDVEVPMRAGQAAINPPGVWHTAKVTGQCTALFITAGEGTLNAEAPHPLES